MSTIPNDISIGTRIQVGDDRATVRYIGQVTGSTGEWLGVEWDDDKRGKHDGSHNGTLYFTCRSKSSGSFIRYNAKKVWTGRSFLEALTAKYLEASTDHQDPVQGNPINTTNTTTITKDGEILYLGGNKNIQVETVGFEKIQKAQSQLHDLKIVGLLDMRILDAGKDKVIAHAGLSMEDLDLSKNLINDWTNVANITSQLPRLMILRLNHIRLLPPNIDVLNSFSPSPFDHLKTLVLCNTHITWDQVLQLDHLFLHLEDLQLSGNGIQTIDRAPIHMRQLKCINLEDNCLQDWKEINHFSSLPNLQTLFLNGNMIQTIDIIPNTFTQLAFLRIDRNQLQAWTNFDILDQLPSLVKLRCHENPIFKDLHVEESAAQIIGRIHGLTTLNGNTITDRERIDLERFYLKLCTRDGDTPESIKSLHPRFLQLCRVHGEPDFGQNKQNIGMVTSTTLNQRLMTITLSHLPLDSEQALYQHHSANDLPPPKQSVDKRVLATMLVRSLRHLIQKLFGIPASRQHLFLIQQQQHSTIIMDMTDDLRDLKFYSITQGDQIIILDY
ncbi:uncharacterized protein BX664DRAFT_339788 [Halteromyces radiatus]|uniref:uncharacterized protein n=1 Tax=Halteromyces radiatus TaxID=101107 RepID=UPI00221E754D|nr:uncharacterized protein BX664DRAFT_339788 [Halteromyces radiatus]KAI8083086.1 hypothetical protein BX664DRAFT_339788 [Halteromyces radiatus]